MPSGEAGRPTVLVVEDMDAIQQLITVSLPASQYEVLLAASAEEAQTLLTASLPDLVLLDWVLPGQSGVNLARKLRAERRTRSVPILMLSARGEEPNKIYALDCGVDDYMTKPFSPRELAARVQALLRRRRMSAGETSIAFGGLRLEPASQRVLAGSRALALGPAEFSLLHLLMRYPNRIHSRSWLLDQLYRPGEGTDERAVDTRVRRLRRVLADAGQDCVVETVRGSGYRLTLQADAARP